MIKYIVALLLITFKVFATDTKAASPMSDMTLIPYEGKHLQIVTIVPKSLWEQFGFAKDDIIINYNSTQVDNPSQAMDILKTAETKGKHRIILLRGQKQKVITYEIK
jgi:hypothetical protein